MNSQDVTNFRNKQHCTLQYLFDKFDEITLWFIKIKNLFLRFKKRIKSNKIPF